MPYIMTVYYYSLFALLLDIKYNKQVEKLSSRTRIPDVGSRENKIRLKFWIAAFAGMTNGMAIRFFSTVSI